MPVTYFHGRAYPRRAVLSIYRLSDLKRKESSMADHRKKFEVFRRSPLPREPLGTGSSSAGKNIVREAVGFDTAEQTVAEVAKIVAIDPSVAVRRTTDDRVFHRDELAVIVKRNLPDLLER
jgi:hypothetical protein